MQRRYCKSCGKRRYTTKFYKGFKVCKECDIDRRIKAQQTPEGRVKHVAIQTKYKLKTVYGTTPEKFYAVNNCEICFRTREERVLCNDHNHITGKVRGVLCFVCNLQIGLLENGKNFRPSSWVDNAWKYLDKYDGEVSTCHDQTVSVDLLISKMQSSYSMNSSAA